MTVKTSNALLAATFSLAAITPLWAQEASDAGANAVSDAAAAVADGAEKLGDAAKSMVDGAKSVAGDAAKAAGDAVKDAADMAKTGKDAADEMAKDAAEAVTDTADTAADAAEATMEKAEGAMKEATEATGDAADATMEKAEDAAKGAAAETEKADGEMAKEGAEANAADKTAEATPAETIEPQIGQYYEKERFDDWFIRCIKTEDGRDPCELFQLLKDAQGNPVSEFSLIPLRNGGKAVAGATLMAPLETDLIAGLGFQIDSAAAKGYPFNFCGPLGCVARLGFTEAELSALKRGNKASVSLMPYGGNPKEDRVSLDVSLIGFTAAYEALNGIVDELTQK